MQYSHPNPPGGPGSVADELEFLRKQTGKDEPTLLAEAVSMGLDLLYRRTIEKMFVDDEISRLEAVGILGEEYVANLEYAKKALTTDIKQAFLE